MGAGEYTPADIKKGDFVIAADGGRIHLEKTGVTPDLTVGDFDSSLPPESGNVVMLPKAKDITDTQAAIGEGLKRGYTEFHLYGCMGGRQDHTQANIQCIAGLAEKKIFGVLYGGDTIITALSRGRIKITDAKGTFSVLSLTNSSKGVYLNNVKYPLNNAALANSASFSPYSLLAVSNEFSGGESTISVSEGILLIYLPISAAKNITFIKD